MHIAYFDEAGDDGWPNKSSSIFVLSSLYFHHQDWRDNFSIIRDFRKKLYSEYRLPVGLEFHTMHFLKDQFPYHGKFRAIRREVLLKFARLIASLECKIINVVIDKNKIRANDYLVLEKALTYNIQRIENDMRSKTPEHRQFMIITDPGRIAPMRRIARKIQRINFIPSHYDTQPYRREIENLIEDPLQKESSESYFIQLVDIVATITYLYASSRLVVPALPWATRIRAVLQPDDDLLLMDYLKPSLNLQASLKDKFGVVCYPQ